MKRHLTPTKAGYKISIPRWRDITINMCDVVELDGNKLRILSRGTGSASIYDFGEVVEIKHHDVDKILSDPGLLEIQNYSPTMKA